MHVFALKAQRGNRVDCFHVILLKSRVADPVGFHPDPTLEKNPESRCDLGEKNESGSDVG